MWHGLEQQVRVVVDAKDRAGEETPLRQDCKSAAAERLRRAADAVELPGARCRLSHGMKQMSARRKVLFWLER